MVDFHPVLGAYVFTVSYTSLLSFHYITILNISIAYTTFITGTLMKEHANMVLSSPQVNIINIVNMSTTMMVVFFYAM